jgi:hypothetical protein
MLPHMDIICADYRVAWTPNRHHMAHALPFNSTGGRVCAAPGEPAASRAIQTETNNHADIANIDVMQAYRWPPK